MVEIRKDNYYAKPNNILLTITRIWGGSYYECELVYLLVRVSLINLQKRTLPTGIVSQRISIDIAAINYDEGPNIALDKP